MGVRQNISISFDEVNAANLPDLMELLGEQARAHKTALSCDENIVKRELEKIRPTLKGVFARDAHSSTPLGMIIYNSWGTPHGKTLHIEDIVIAEAARGEGVGSSLMDNFKTVARHEGANAIEWAVAESNTKAISFYENRVHARRLHLREYTVNEYLARDAANANTSTALRLNGRGIKRLRDELGVMPLIQERTIENIEAARLRSHNLEVFVARGDGGAPLALAIANKNFSTFRAQNGYSVEFIDLGGEDDARERA